MIAAISNHLWQSTLFAVAAALAVAALRRNRAEIRHAIWFAASVKFLLPFSALIALGAALAPARSAPLTTAEDASASLSVAVDQLAQPFDHVFLPRSGVAGPGVPTTARYWPAVAMTAWAAGFLVVTGIRLRGWRRIQNALRSSSRCPLQLPDMSMEVRATSDVLEPGVVGWMRPVLLLPSGLERHLNASQLSAVIAHELCHARRRDNLTAAIHMAVEAAFWFHPLVWWISARLVDERERACDEYVLANVAEPREYAEGILAVCKRYVASPVTFVSGVTGADLKRRIANIITGRVGLPLTFARRGVLMIAAVAAIVTPFLAGVATAPLRAQQNPVNARFAVVSIKPCPSIASRPPVPAQAGGGRSGGAPWDAQTSPGYVYWNCTTLAQLVDQAYADTDHPLLNTPLVRRIQESPSSYPRRVRGGPSWVTTEMFTIEARAPLEVTQGALSGNPSRTLATLTVPMSQALRTMLEARFQVKVRREKEQQDMFALRVSPGGLNSRTITKPTPGDCLTPAEYFAMDPGQRPPDPALCGRANITMDRGQVFTSFTMRQLATFLSTSSIDRYVLDETGLDEPFNFVLKLDRESAPPDVLFARALEQLGLKLVSTKGPAEYFQIDSAQRPSPDGPASVEGTAKAAGPVSAQDRFEVASIKLNTTGSGQFDIHSEPGGRIVATNITLQQLITNAYDLPAFRVAGGPDWLTKDHFDLEARATGLDSSNNLFQHTKPGTPSRGEALLRALLADRFKLETHLETRQLSLFELTFARPDQSPGPQLKRSTRDCGDNVANREPEASNPREAPPCGVMSAPGMLLSGGIALSDLAAWLEPITERTVVDRTGAAGRFEFVLKWTPDQFSRALSKKAGSTHWAAIDDDGPSLGTALREQLGLKLESRTGPVPVLVIDRVSRLIPN